MFCAIVGLTDISAPETDMAEEATILSKRANAAKTRQAMRVQRREACRDIVAPGYSHRQIAYAMSVSLAPVRREVDNALANGRSARPSATPPWRSRD